MALQANRPTASHREVDEEGQFSLFSIPTNDQLHHHHHPHHDGLGVRGGDGWCTALCGFPHPHQHLNPQSPQSPTIVLLRVL